MQADIVTSPRPLLRGQEMASGYSGPRQLELTGNKDSLSASGEEGWL